MNDQYSIHNSDVKVRYLIYHHSDPINGEVKVFVDDELDLDWECDDVAGKLVDSPELKDSFRKIVNDVAALEPVSQNWPLALKLTSKRLLGEAIATILRGDTVGAKIALEHAKKFISAKSKQVSRFWTLQGCLFFGGFAVVASGLQLLTRTVFESYFGKTPTVLLFCFWAGCLGALLFVLLRIGRQPRVDSTAEKELHYLEAAGRIFGGGIAGVFLGGMVKLGLILPVFGQTGMETLAMCAVAMIGGASERLIAGVITKVENGEGPKQENNND